ncbi:MAG: hypothetical protein J6A17_00985 [Bacilli bacterium]|nr:hypothetical protein [Bacilli bacterium]
MSKEDLNLLLPLIKCYELFYEEDFNIEDKSTFPKIQIMAYLLEITVGICNYSPFSLYYKNLKYPISMEIADLLLDFKKLSIDVRDEYLLSKDSISLRYEEDVIEIGKEVRTYLSEDKKDTSKLEKIAQIVYTAESVVPMFDDKELAKYTESTFQDVIKSKELVKGIEDRFHNK